MKKFKFIIDGIKYEVSVDEIEQNVASIEVNGTPFTVEIEREQKYFQQLLSVPLNRQLLLLKVPLVLQSQPNRTALLLNHRFRVA